MDSDRFKQIHLILFTDNNLNKSLVMLAQTQLLLLISLTNIQNKENKRDGKVMHFLYKKYLLIFMFL